MSGWIKVGDKTPPVGKNLKVCIERDDGSREISDATYQDGKHNERHANAIFDISDYDDIDEIIPEGWYGFLFFECGWAHYGKLSSRERVTHWLEGLGIPLPAIEEDKDNESLACCPFCGNADIEIESYHLKFWGKCRNCLAEGPPADSEEEATRRWNERGHINDT